MRKKIILGVVVGILLTACSGTGAPLDSNTEVKKYTIGSGPVLIEEFADFQCPACGQVSPILKAYALQNPNVVTLEYNHFPLSQHENAIPAAVAAECAGTQEKFWEFAEEIFANQGKLGEALYLEIAKDLKLDETKFTACVEDETVKKQVLLSAQEGNQRGVNSTPTLFVSTEGEEPQKVNFSEQFFDFVEQRAQGIQSDSSTPNKEEETSEGGSLPAGVLPPNAAQF